MLSYLNKRMRNMIINIFIIGVYVYAFVTDAMWTRTEFHPFVFTL